MKFNGKAGRGAGFEGGTGQVELFAPKPGSNWLGPPGDTDFLVRLHDTERAYKAVKRAGYKVSSDSHDPAIWETPRPRGLTAKQMRDIREHAMASPRAFLVEAAGYLVYVDYAV